jgi:hypothetical protein
VIDALLVRRGVGLELVPHSGVLGRYASRGSVDAIAGCAGNQPLAGATGLRVVGMNRLLQGVDADWFGDGILAQHLDLAKRGVELRVGDTKMYGVAHGHCILKPPLDHTDSRAQFGARPCGRVVAIANAGSAVTTQHREGDAHENDGEHRRRRNLWQQTNLPLNAELTRGAMQRRKRGLA